MNNKKILVIEDDSSIQELIVEFLSVEGYDVKSANDGLEGIQLFKKEKFFHEIFIKLNDSFAFPNGK